MVHEVQMGKLRTRQSFSHVEEILDMPDLIEVQKNSYQRFLDVDLREVLDDVSPIVDYTENLSLEFVDYTLDEPKNSVERCKERDMTYAAPLKVFVRLKNRETGEIKESDVFMGDFPLMTDYGTFIINGAERVIVSQLVRSPGVYYEDQIDKAGKHLFSTTVIPNRGAWLEYETDSNDVLWVRIDRARKLPITLILRALGYGTDAEIIDLLGEDERLMATIQRGDNAKSREEGLIEIYKRQKPGEPPTHESAQNLFNSLFFDSKRYDLMRVGRYKFNKKLSLATRAQDRVAAEDVVNPQTGEVMVHEGEVISKEVARAIQNAGVNSVLIRVDNHVHKIVGNHFVDASLYLPFPPREAGVMENVLYPVLREILDMGLEGDELKEMVRSRVHDLVPKHIITEDIVASISYLLGLPYGVGFTDDIDHLGNRRLRSVGELLQNQIRIGLSRLERVVRERMAIQDSDEVRPGELINIRPVSAAIKEFFGSSQLSQFMDQPNPLAELTHKRRLSA
ncbi:MAG: DNA-directed RNA polymerase subunit beta, partial [Clostridia bacterium]|nr:DNA-directed RNA polymerase subunit beta [Clostridia bacterium]